MIDPVHSLAFSIQANRGVYAILLGSGVSRAARIPTGWEITLDLVRTFYRRGIIETWGRGTLKIARLMREAGHEPPTVFAREGAVVVTFGLPGKMPRKRQGNDGETPQKTLQKTPQSTPVAILELLKQQPGLTFAQMAALLGKSESAVKRAVRKLRESGRLGRIGPDKGGHWKVKE